MAFWLLKSEPETWSWESQVKKGTKGEPWSGVRNYQARLNLRAMKKGERAFFYHSGELRAVVGIVEIVKEAYPDHSAEKGEWSMVDVVAVEPFKVPVTLVDAKAAAMLSQMVLVKNTRLSVQPVTEVEWKLVCKMGGLMAT
ncbi:MAG: EVE domain-containing protein [Alphaproteobacteria bacterium]|nr:EVE domain-containing protein [Alphaproteobacteria bacterium]